MSGIGYQRFFIPGIYANNEKSCTMPNALAANKSPRMLELLSGIIVTDDDIFGMSSSFQQSSG